MLYGIAGDGSGNQTEIKATLEDLRAKATKDEADFWIVMMAKEEPTKTDLAVLKWLRDNDIWFEVVGDESEAYEGAQAFHSAKNPYDTLVSLLSDNKESGVLLLALFVDTENDADEDTDLSGAVEAAIEADIEVRLLNGQMVRLQFGGDEPEAEPEEAAAPEEPEGDEEPEGAFTEAELKKMTVPELTAIAKGQGLTVAKGSSKGDIIATVLGGGPVAASTFDSATARSITGATTAGALLVVVVNGSVHIKPVTVEEAAALV